MTDKKEDVIRLVKAKLDDNKRSYIACNNSCESILTMCDLLHIHKPSAKILVICTDTLHRPEVVDALANPNETWGNYDVVMCSPSVQSGVSYDAKPLAIDTKDITRPDCERGLFDSIFGIVGNSTNSSGDACQMLHRVRHPISNDVVVSFTYSALYANHSGGGITNKYEYIRYLSRVRNFGDFEKSNKDGQGEFRTIENMTHYEYNDFNEADFKSTWYFNMYVDFKIVENLDRRDYAKNFIDKQLIFGNTVTMLDETDTAEYEIEKANAMIKDNTRDTKHARKVAHAHALDNADHINDDKKKEIDKKMMTLHGGITEAEQLEYKKHVLNSVYTMREPAVGFGWYKAMDDKTRMNQFVNLKPFTNHGSLQECLKTVVQQERRAEIKRRQVVKDGEHGIMGAADTETAIIKSLAFTKYKAVKMTMLVGWLETLGFTSLYDDRIIKAEDLKTRLTVIHKKYFVNARDVCSILGKKKYKMKTIEKNETR